MELVHGFTQTGFQHCKSHITGTMSCNHTAYARITYLPGHLPDLGFIHSEQMQASQICLDLLAGEGLSYLIHDYVGPAVRTAVEDDQTIAGVGNNEDILVYLCDS